MLEVDLRARAPIPLDARFRVAPGELVALVGPSGAGKSTVLRAIAGLWRPREGRIAVGGEIWFDGASGVSVPTHLRAVGMVHQSYALFPHMTALGNVLASMGRKPDPARAAALLAAVNLAGLEDRRPAELSGGQQQRVAVARALARDPKALLLDEPFSAVDRTTRERLYREIADLRRRLTMPVVLVTHDLDEAARLADRIVVLREGRSLQDGPPQEVALRPANPEVARLVGLRNLFEGRVVGADAEGYAVLDWAGLRLETRARGLRAGPAVWAVPEAFVILHRRDRPSRGERENPVPGVLSDVLALGQMVEISLRPDHAPERPLRFSAPLIVAERNGLAVGLRAAVSLVAEGIHIMPSAAA